MYEIFEKLMNERGVSAYKVSVATGVAQSTLSDWKNGKTNPKIDKMQKIADFFNVPVEYLMTGKWDEKKSESGKKYYFNDETAQMAQSLFEQKDLRMLFDAAQNCKPEDLKMAADLLKRLKETNVDG